MLFMTGDYKFIGLHMTSSSYTQLTRNVGVQIHIPIVTSQCGFHGAYE